MPVAVESYFRISQELHAKGVTLVAVSKTKPEADLLELYQLGQRDFGENYVQELVEKQAKLPADIRWHYIGHLQTNKVKYIAPFVHLIHGVDSYRLLKEISKEAGKQGRVIEVLLQMHIAQEETKFGLSADELDLLLQELRQHPLPHIRICGVMGMASFIEDLEKIRKEFRSLRQLADQLTQRIQQEGYREFALPLVVSMGMSGDYTIAVEEGSTLVRIGSLLFGARS